MSVDLHTAHDEFHAFPNHMYQEDYTPKLIYKSTTHYFSDVGSSSHVQQKVYMTIDFGHWPYKSISCSERYCGDNIKNAGTN